MNDFNINNEYEGLIFTSKQGLTSLSNIKQLFMNLQMHFESFYSEARISLENYYAEQIKIDCRMASAKTAIDLYINFDQYLLKLKEVITKMDKDVIDPISLFHQQVSSIYVESLNDLRQVAITVTDQKRNIERHKQKYYESCKNVIEKESNLLLAYNKKSTEIDLEQANDQILKIKSLAENNQEQYKYELIKFNKCIEEIDEKYYKKVNILKSNEESRIFFLKCHFEKFNKIFEEYNISGFDFINRLSSSISEIVVCEDIKFFNEKYNSYNNERFPKEIFHSYESFKLDEKMTNTLDSFKQTQNSNLTKKSNQNDNGYINITPFFINDDFEHINKSDIPNEEFSESYYINIINKFLVSICSSKEVNVESIGYIIKYINSDYQSSKNSLSESCNFSKLFIDLILSDKKALSIIFLNFDNLNHFSNILNTITINISDLYCENYDLNFAIIYIAGRTFFKNSTDSKITQEKIYLSAILSLNALYSTKSFWIDLIELKIARKVEESVRKYNSGKKKDSDISYNASSNYNTQQNSNYFTNNNSSIFNLNAYTTNSSSNSSLIGSMGSKLKGLFRGSKNNNKANILKDYNQTNVTRDYIKERENNILEYLKYQEASTVLREFIIHFANFNLDITDAMNIIVEIATNYNFPKERISLYATLLNSYSFTVKNKLPESIRKRRYTSSFKASKVIESKENIYSLAINEKKFEIIFQSSLYLSKSDLFSILCLSKESYQKLNKKVIGKLLGEVEFNDMKTRIVLWKVLLNTNRLKEEICYKSCLEDFFKFPNKSDSSINDIINLDVARTYFEYDAENTRRSICNILKTLAMIKPEINYCQGMNYIASFIFNNTKDEIETFYLMLGLFSNTEYKIMFLNDLSRLKQFFYIFDRLLTLNLPEINNYLKTNTIMCNYFCSPWFITLFTNSYHFKSSQELPKIIIKIWDDFILNGWEALVRAGIVLLKLQEEILLKMKYEELLHYLINDLIKRSFYDNENYDKFMSLQKDIIFKAGLLSNIENESLQEKRIKEVDESYASSLQI